MEIHTGQVLYAHRTTRERTDRFALHCHPFYECYYFISGEVRYLVEGVPYTLRPDSLLLMAGGVFHGMLIHSDAPYERCTLHFEAACLPESVRTMLLKPFHAQPVYHTNAGAFRMHEFFQAIEDCVDMRPPLREEALSLRIASLLAQVRHMAEVGGGHPPATETAALDQQIIAYVNANLSDSLTLEGIARHFFISRNHLCRTFHRATGSTVGAYIRQKRLILAQQLRTRGQSAAEAAVNAGFGDYSTYYRAHRRLLHSAPSQAHTDA